ncbi:unnamed protein product [Ranitomeya imitator]|uniref:Reverse transcriptase domain-containing protein n=1 Tax=Ranitomeya imitator TaxID=111125 RepID=A0ABN9LZ41_9NEOB|nr:unnamed protein product [Ranitomeya imitator]
MPANSSWKTGNDADYVVKLIKFILTNNYFEFVNKIYLQETGTAMGSNMAPQYANLFMAKFEGDFLSSCPIRPLANYRYIYDILIIWMESEPQLKMFHERFNQFHSTINFTLNYSSTEINFLDTIIKLQNNEIETSLYQKPIDHPTYLKWDSFHPKHIKNSIVYSQAIRYNHICAKPMDMDEHLGHLRKTFLNQGYHPRTIQTKLQDQLEYQGIPCYITKLKKKTKQPDFLPSMCCLDSKGNKGFYKSSDWTKGEQCSLKGLTSGTVYRSGRYGRG